MPRALPSAPYALPVVGHLPLMVGDPLRFFSQLGRDFGDIVAFRVGRQQCVFINEPGLLDRVVRDRTMFRTLATRRAMGSFLGQGLFSLEDAPHLRQRRLMQPAFHKQRIAGYAAIMAEETERALRGLSDGDTRDLRADMSEVTLSIVGQCLFNTDARHHVLQVSDALARITPWALRGARFFALFPRATRMPYPASVRRAIDGLHELVRGLVAERRQSGEDRGDLLSMLLAARDSDGSALSDEDVCSEALTVLLAGHETTALMLSWAWYLLTQHPEVQEALVAQIEAQTGGRAVTPSDLPSLPLVQQVVNETLRLYPTAWMGDRLTAGQVELGGHDVPAGTPVLFSVYVTHRDARFFPEPERFDPGRFSPERKGELQSGAYLPFGGGVHVCIGNAFALLEGQLLLAALAQRFRVRAVSQQRVRPSPSITLGMRDPFHVRLEARTKN